MVTQELQMKMPAYTMQVLYYSISCAAAGHAIVHLDIHSYMNSYLMHLPFKLTLTGLLQLPVMLLQTTLLTEKVQISLVIAAIEQVTEVVVRRLLVQGPQSDSVLY